jgi:hypothetical protein
MNKEVTWYSWKMNFGVNKSRIKLIGPHHKKKKKSIWGVNKLWSPAIHYPFRKHSKWKLRYNFKCQVNFGVNKSRIKLIGPHHKKKKKSIWGGNKLWSPAIHYPFHKHSKWKLRYNFKCQVNFGVNKSRIKLIGPHHKKKKKSIWGGNKLWSPAIHYPFRKHSKWKLRYNFKFQV